MASVEERIALLKHMNRHVASSPFTIRADRTKKLLRAKTAKEQRERRARHIAPTLPTKPLPIVRYHLLPVDSRVIYEIVPFTKTHAVRFYGHAENSLFVLIDFVDASDHSRSVPPPQDGVCFEILEDMTIKSFEPLPLVENKDVWWAAPTVKFMYIADGMELVHQVPMVWPGAPRFGCRKHVPERYSAFCA